MATGLGDEVAWWCPSLDDAGNGTTTLNDESGNGHTGTLTNMEVGSDWVANTENGGVRALSFDGTNEDVSIPDSSDFTFGNSGSIDSPFSISAWVKLNSFGANKGAIVSKGTDNSPFNMEWIFLCDSSSKLFMSMYDNGTSHTIKATATNALATATWYHVVATYDGLSDEAGIQFYIDGVAETMVPGFAGTYLAMHNKTSTLNIGSSIKDSIYDRWWDGLLDDIRIYDRVPTADEITHLGTARAVQGSPSSGVNQSACNMLLGT